MKNLFTLLAFTIIALASLAQKTKVEGQVTDAETGEAMPYVKVQFQDAKIGAITDFDGKYSIETYYATDSLLFSFSGYKRVTKKVVKDEAQLINVALPILITEFDEVVVRPPDEFPSVTLHKKMVANKDINNREKLDAYEYELYNKLQLDLNNIGDKFKENKVMKKLDFIMAYLDSSENEKTYLPILLTESISDFYFKNSPKKKIEVMQAYQVSGTEDLQFNQFLGDMYLDINIYDNYINMFGKGFISPTANFARSFYRFYLDDSSFIDNQWCYKLRFLPKRTGDLTFTGEMWIHDTTYAIKQFKANISGDANINYIQDMYFEHHFDMVAPEVWMLTEEKMIADVNITEKSKMYGFYGRKYSSRKNFVINKKRPDEFYRIDENVRTSIGASTRTLDYWAERRHKPLSHQEERIEEMVDSLNHDPYFKLLKNITYMATTGYYIIDKIEVGNAFGLWSTNPVEDFRLALALRTSNNFSKKIELGGSVAYGFGDDRFKFQGKVRTHLSKKKRTLLSLYFKNDLDQVGQAEGSSIVGSTFGTVLRTGPLDKLSFISKTGIHISRDVKKDLIFTSGFELREIESLGLAKFARNPAFEGENDTINSVRTSEFTASIRWARGEEFIAGAFDRTSIKTLFPIIELKGTFGIKGIWGSQFEYQKLELTISQKRPTGIFGHIDYYVNFGKIFGEAAYPFLKVHEGNQSYYLLEDAFNKLNFYEFISDQYATVSLAQHWGGFFMDRLPLMKKLKWRFVSAGRITYGTRQKRHSSEYLMPNFVKEFNNIPYAEANLGVENILKVFRIDMVWRLTHQIPGKSPLGIRVKFAINF
jgi:hypothetical protein